MLNRRGIILFCATLSVFCYPILADSNNTFSFETTIQRYYDSWKDCKQIGTAINYNNITYSLERASLVEKTGKFKAIYSIPTELKITYSSWDECRKSAAELESNNLIYEVVRFDKIGKTEKFLATYELKGITE